MTTAGVIDRLVFHSVSQEKLSSGIQTLAKAENLSDAEQQWVAHGERHNPDGLKSLRGLTL